MSTQSTSSIVSRLAVAASIAALSLSATAETRFWADSNGASEKFNRAESWDPAPGSMESTAGDTFVLNKGEDKIAVVEGGDDVTVGKLCVGQGENNRGGRLDVTGGSLNVAGDFIVGDDTGASAASNIVRVTGSTVGAKKLYVGKSGKGEFTLEGGSLVLDSGNGDITLCDGANDEATVNFISGQVVYHQLNITQNGGMAVVNIGKDCTVDAGWATYAGANSEFNIYGEFLAHPSVNLGNKTGGPSVINLCGDETKRGLLRTAEIVARSEGCVLNWNGGRLMRKSFEYIGGNDILPLNGGQPTSASPLTVVVGENGAYFESLDDKANDSISKPLSGAGAFVKLGGGTLTLKGAVNLKGGFKVENGVLNVENVARTSFKTIELAAGASLNLNEAEVTVERYVVGGNEYGPGRYAEQNGLIVVAPPAVGAPETAVWLNSLGDSDLNNPDNWMVKNSEGQVLADALPDSNTEVFVYVGVQRPDFTGLAVRSISLIAKENTYLRGNGCKPPAIVKAANGWYDFDDASTVVLSDETSISLVKNKGSAGAALDAEVFGKVETDPAPLYGVNSVYGRSVMSMTTSDQDATRRRGLQTAELGLTNNQDRVIISVSRRGSARPHYPIGIECQDNTNFNPERKLGHFRIQHFQFVTGFFYCGAKSSSIDETTGQTTYTYDGMVLNPEPEQKFDDWTISLFQSANKEITAKMYSEAKGLSSKTETAMDLNTQPSARLYIGHARFNENDANRGQVAEALYYDHALTSEQIDSIYDYLKAKWLTPGDVSNIPSNIILENSAALDFGGGSWTFNTIKGAGTIGTANINIIDSIEPGLTVEGSVTFGQNATIDISSLNKVSPGTEVVFLTADSVANWPHKVSSKVRKAIIRLVDNQDGTVSLVGTLDSTGFCAVLR